jgi:hypothetical protein
MFIAAMIVLFGLNVTAHADEEGTVIANIPFAFVVDGKTLPAGTYNVSRVSQGSELLISSWNTGVFVIPTELDSSGAQKPVVSFEKLGDTYFLRQVNTPIGSFIIDTRGEITNLTRLKQQASMTSSGSQ